MTQGLARDLHNCLSGCVVCMECTSGRSCGITRTLVFGQKQSPAGLASKRKTAHAVEKQEKGRGFNGTEVRRRRAFWVARSGRIERLGTNCGCRASRSGFQVFCIVFCYWLGADSCGMANRLLVKFFIEELLSNTPFMSATVLLYVISKENF